jgi:hypothetical protein
MKTRTHFTHRIDLLNAVGETPEHLASVEDSKDYGAKQSRGGRGRRLFCGEKGGSFRTAAGCEWSNEQTTDCGVDRCQSLPSTIPSTSANAPKRRAPLPMLRDEIAKNTMSVLNMWNQLFTDQGW